MSLRCGGAARSPLSVRFHAQHMPKYKSLDAESSPMAAPGSSGPHSYAGGDGGGGGGGEQHPAPADCGFTPAAQRLRLNEQRIKLLTAINAVVGQRAELEAGRGALQAALDELRRKLRRKLRRRIDDSFHDKKERLKALKAANLRLEREKFGIMSEVEHLQRHLEREESHHVQHARTAVAQPYLAPVGALLQAIQGVVSRAPPPELSACSIADLPNLVSRSVARNAPSRLADNKLAAARLMRDIAELRARVAQVEARLAAELKRKRQAELDIVRLRKELSATKSCVASLRLPACPLRTKCCKFA